MTHVRSWSRYDLDLDHDLDHFFISSTLTRNVKLILAKNQAKAKQHPEAELVLFENYF